VAASFGAASLSAKVFQASLGIFGVLSIAAGAVAVFAGSMGNATKKSEELTAANFEAAGGLQAFKKASQEGIASGAKVYNTISASVKSLTKEQEEERRSQLKARVARAELTKSTDEGKKAYDEAELALRKFNAEVERGIGITDRSTLSFTENTKELIANALAQIDTGGDAPLNIFSEISEFDLGMLSPSAKASLEKSGIDFVKVLNDSIEAAMTGDMTAVEFMEEQFSNADFTMGQRNSRYLSEFAATMLQAAEATDGYITEAERVNAVNAIMGKVTGNTGESVEELEGDYIDLNSVLKENVGLLTKIASAEGSLQILTLTLQLLLKKTAVALMF
jgi:hypothetical protein